MNIDLSDFDDRHAAYIEQLAKELDAIYAAVIRQAVKYGLSVNFDASKGEIFNFDRFPKLKKRVEQLFADMQSQILVLVQNGISEEWHLSADKNDYLLEELLASTSLTKDEISAFKSRNLEALATFQRRKMNGLGLSDRVWNLTDSFRAELELALDVGIGEGRSAAQISRDIRGYLNQPDKLFRRVRDKHGSLKLSKAAAAYHPGQGVYRSSYKNALRMARTEVNMAYRTADHERWQDEWFVIGIRIHLSNNHTLNGKPFHDICDLLEGDYPKAFKFTGWHPQCRCYVTSILCTDEDFEEYLKQRREGKDVSGFRFKGEVKELPKAFRDWMGDNAERVERIKQKPHFITDNQNVIYKRTPQQIAEERHASRTEEQIAEIRAKWEERRKRYELIKNTANNVLKVAYEYGEVDYSKLQQYISEGNLTAMQSETKVVAKQVSVFKKQEKALSDLIPDVHGWHKQFTITELQDVYKAVKKKLSSLSSLTLEQQAKKLKFEAYDFLGGNMDGVQQKYKTWEVSQSAYIKELDSVNYKIDYDAQAVILDEIDKWSKAHPKSIKVKNLLNEATSAWAAKGNMTTIKAKVAAAKAEMDKRIAEQVRRNAKKLATVSMGTMTMERINDLLDEYQKVSLMDMDDLLRPITEKVWSTLTDEERKILTKYTQTYSYLNEPLRGLTYFGGRNPDEFTKDLPVLTGAIKKFKVPEDIVVRRGTSDYPILSLGYNLSNVKVGDKFVDGGFLSTSAYRGTGFFKEYEMIIVVPKGAQGAFAEPFSHYTDSGKFDFGDYDSPNLWDGKSKENIGGEFEWIGQRGCEFQVIKKEGKKIYLQLTGQLK